MSAPHINLDGYALRSLELMIGSQGPWVVDVEFLEQPVSLGSRVSLAIGSTTLSGSIVSAQSGGAALSTHARVVGGAGGWGRRVSSRGYHNDAGVSALKVAQDIAAEVGETLGNFAPSAPTLGIDFVRREQAASRTIAQVTGASAVWWVDYAGITHVGQRPANTPDPSGFQLLSYDVINRIAEFTADDLDSLSVGSLIIDERIESGPLTVRDLMLRVSGDEPLRITAWCNALAAEPSRLAGLLQTIVRQLAEQRLVGCYRYRVVSVGAADKRLTLQAVRRAAGLPDIQLVSQWPGLPGLSASLTPGSEVLVQFVEGDPTQPVATAYAGPDGASFAPVGMVIGGDVGAPAARQGDAVEVLIPPAVFTGTLSGAPLTGTITWLMPKADGTILTGSGKVSIA